MKAFITFALVAFSFSSFANLNEVIRPYLGLQGQATLDNESSGPCKVTIFENKLWIFAKEIELNARMVEDSSRQTVFLSSHDGQRIGGDMCGDLGGMFRYKRELVVNHAERSLAVVQQFRCVSNLKKRTIMHKCQF